jgi:hypothetical protein
MVPLGIEPRTYCVLSRCDNQLHHGTLLMLANEQKPSGWNDDDEAEFEFAVSPG